MRFFVTGEHNRQLLLNALILMFLGYILLLWISNGMLFFHKMGLTAEAVTSYYLGSEQEFTQPKSYQSMLEVTHYHVFSMGMLVLTLTHLMLMTDLSVRLKIVLSAVIYLSAIADELGGWFVRYLHPYFAYFKITSFILLELSLAALIIIVSLSLLQARRLALKNNKNKS